MRVVPPGLFIRCVIRLIFSQPLVFLTVLLIMLSRYGFFATCFLGLVSGQISSYSAPYGVNTTAASASVTSLSGYPTSPASSSGSGTSDITTAGASGSTSTISFTSPSAANASSTASNGGATYTNPILDAVGADPWVLILQCFSPSKLNKV